MKPKEVFRDLYNNRKEGPFFSAILNSNMSCHVKHENPLLNAVFGDAKQILVEDLTTVLQEALAQRPWLAVPVKQVGLFRATGKGSRALNSTKQMQKKMDHQPSPHTP